MYEKTPIWAAGKCIGNGGAVGATSKSRGLVFGFSAKGVFTATLDKTLDVTDRVVIVTSHTDTYHCIAVETSATVVTINIEDKGDAAQNGDFSITVLKISEGASF